MAKSSWQNRITGEGVEAPDQLLANPRNWRIHPQRQQAALRSALDRVGWVQRVIVNQRTGHVVDGHLRVAMALQRNEAQIPVSYVDLDPQEEALVLASFDEISRAAEKDRDAHAELIADLELPDDDALAELLAGEAALGAGDEPEVETVVIERPVDVVWVLLAIPVDEYALVQDAVASLEEHSAIAVQVARPQE